ncbi:hypothetical protein C5167_002379 [Papaver somniferum]|uniref:Uncharacterized protein n=1 Tax=Papaver somniferum TaxID=3469 RepID=A0A4Y7KZJ3_PAPSO|nr:hypothetical protein C5167_002379 [Papaver somniferum]
MSKDCVRKLFPLCRLPPLEVTESILVGRLKGIAADNKLDVCSNVIENDSGINVGGLEKRVQTVEGHVDAGRLIALITRFQNQLSSY